MFHRIAQIALIILLIPSCTSPVPQGKVRSTSFDESSRLPKKASSTLFHNQKDKLDQITPKDERRKDQKIDALLKTIEKSIEKKDVNLLLSVMDEDIISSHGGGMYGYSDFKETWGDDYQNLWNKLNKILAMGGTFVDDSTYRLPYDGNIDEKAGKLIDNIVPFGCGITTNVNTKLYPNARCLENEAVVIGRVFTLIDLVDGFYGGRNDIWKINILGTGIHGYVKDEDYYCSADYSLIIEKNKQGIWKISAFAPWD